ncbi:hypothetical protein GWI33_020736 [Rhynchophorus ferrugineus]|uniref:Uncharacterized protein n=1 Tax=Rhynchophorus ferrugineus TaxID=354439 RepID=A0A834HQA8_RHYFE|nr:hypothetical protein GWI33_020736 [Rhynchophorus ferrugineus]
MYESAKANGTRIAIKRDTTLSKRQRQGTWNSEEPKVVATLLRSYLGSNLHRNALFPLVCAPEPANRPIDERSVHLDFRPR